MAFVVMALGIMTINITTFWISVFCALMAHFNAIMTISVMALMIKALSIRALNIMTLNIMALSIIVLHIMAGLLHFNGATRLGIMAFVVKYAQHYGAQHNDISASCKAGHIYATMTVGVMPLMIHLLTTQWYQLGP